MILKEHGLSDVAASAIVGNIAIESAGRTDCVESGRYGGGIGLFQQANNNNRQALEDYCSGVEHISHPKVELRPNRGSKSYVICNTVRCQIEATLKELESTMNARHWSVNYNSQVQALDYLHRAALAGQIPESVDIVSTWDGFCNQTDLFTAVMQFQCDYETPNASSCFWVGINSYSDSLATQANFVSSVNMRYEAAQEIYDKYSTIDFGVFGIETSIIAPSWAEIYVDSTDDVELDVTFRGEYLLLIAILACIVLWGSYLYRFVESETFGTLCFEYRDLFGKYIVDVRSVRFIACFGLSVCYIVVWGIL